jgi:hypothetical protein
MHMPYVTKMQPWKIFMRGKIPITLQNLHFDILTISPTRTNRVKRWSKVRVISLIGLQLHWKWFFIIQEMWKTWLTNNDIIISLQNFQKHKGGSLILWIKGVELTSLIHQILKSNLENLNLVIYKDKFLSMTFHLSTQFVWMR